VSQFDYIKEIAKSGLENDQEKLLQSLNELIDYAKKTKKINFALQLQSILREAIRNKQTSGLVVVDSPKHIFREEDREVSEFIIEKLTSDYHFSNLVCTSEVRHELELFVQEHKLSEILNKFELPISNKVLFYGPSGCGKTLASYVLAGELEKLMIVINLGALVSSKLGETSKNLAKIFRRVASEECIVFIDEFDSIGKVRDYQQDHGEMKRVVNTILQLFDYLPQKSIVIAATNQIDMIDDALLRRFDLQIKLDLPDKSHIKDLIAKILRSDHFTLDSSTALTKIITAAEGLSYYTIQKTLITAIKRSIFKITRRKTIPGQKAKIDSKLWLDLIKREKRKN
jgi:SpoVK/Ycf46/Vps4 family AAA+-type ATPase